MASAAIIIKVVVGNRLLIVASFLIRLSLPEDRQPHLFS